MEPERACLILARTPGLSAGRLLALLPGAGCEAAEALERLRAAAHSTVRRPRIAAAIPAVPAAATDAAEAAPPGSGGALPARARTWLNATDECLIDADRRWIDASGCQLICCTSPRYPARLLQHPDAPAVLFVLGKADTVSASQLAMVGARAASMGGRAIAREFASRLAASGLTITSGLALGIDAASHEGALAVGGTTLAVCAHGLDLCYPREHADLAARIREGGALLSAWPPGTQPRRHLFLRRNGLIAGLCLATLVVEATVFSGSLATARCARRLSRGVFAVPGSIRDPLARGCHELIRTGARLVDSADQLLADLKIPLSDHKVNQVDKGLPGSGRGAPPLDKELEMLLDAAGFEPVGIDVLANRTGHSGAALASMLLMLELQGRIALQPGGRYCRLS